jgi:rhamnosyl/mannosyltransferase
MSAVRRVARTVGAKNIIFAGHVSEAAKYALLRRSSVFVLPSAGRGEAFGICLLEASRAGLPLVTCDPDSGSAFVNLHGTTGLVVPPRDPEALRAAILTMLSDSELRNRMGAAARQRFLDLFTAERMIRSHLDLYCGVIGPRN